MKKKSTKENAFKFFTYALKSSLCLIAQVLCMEMFSLIFLNHQGINFFQNLIIYKYSLIIIIITAIITQQQNLKNPIKIRTILKLESYEISLLKNRKTKRTAAATYSAVTGCCLSSPINWQVWAQISQAEKLQMVKCPNSSDSGKRL